MSKPILTQAYLKSLFDYDQETGVFTRLVKRGSRGMPGTVVGNLTGGDWATGGGYLKVSLNRKNEYLHRLAWLYVYGVLPPHDVDHINQIKTDNRIANLRLATKSQNQHNRPVNKNSTSGYTGVRRSATKDNWSARITVSGKEIHIGCFQTAGQAHLAYLAAKAVYHPTAPK